MGNLNLIKGLCRGTVDELSFKYIMEYANAALMFDLIVEDILPVDSTNKFDKSVLHIAAQRGFENVIKIVLDKGVYINCRDGKGMTPLHYATKHLQLKAVLMLLTSEDADVRFANKKGKLAIDYTVKIKSFLPDDADEIISRRLIREILKSHGKKNTEHAHNSCAKAHSNGYQKIHI